MDKTTETAAQVWSTVEAMGAEIRRQAANLTAAEADWLALAAEFDERGGWAQDGCRTCADWLSTNVGLGRVAAYEKLRVAHALQRLPDLDAGFRQGVLSYSKVQALTRIADPDNERELLVLGLKNTANQVDKIVAAFRRDEDAADDAEARAHADRCAGWRHEGATTVFTIRLPTEAATVLMAVIDRFVDKKATDVALKTRRADAAVQMAEEAIAERSAWAVEPEDRYLTTLHLSPSVFAARDNDGNGTPTTADGDGAASCEDRDDEQDGEFDGRFDDDGGMCCVSAGDGLRGDPVAVPLASARRILCDTAMQGFRPRTGDDPYGSLGYTSQTVPRRLKREVRLRDGGCRFPGCHRKDWVDAHHIIHWVDHGPTVVANLICLCRFHHRLFHEGGWS